MSAPDEPLRADGLDEGLPAARLIDRLREHEACHARAVDVAIAVHRALADVEPEPWVVRADVTERMVSYVVKLGPPLRIAVAGLAEDVMGGLAVRTSLASNTPLAVSLALTRASCLNTIHAPTQNPSILRSRYRRIDPDRLRARIAEGLLNAPGRLREGVLVMEAAAREPVAAAAGEVRALLRRARLPVRLVGDVVAAFEREPHQTKFDIAQAIAWGAQRTEPETRWALERAMGAYLARTRR